MLSKYLIDTLAGACVNIDNGATDRYRFGCQHYNMRFCGEYDDQDFDSKTMCCVCGGGRRGKYNAVIRKFSAISRLRELKSILRQFGCLILNQYFYLLDNGSTNDLRKEGESCGRSTTENCGICGEGLECTRHLFDACGVCAKKGDNLDKL